MQTSYSQDPVDGLPGMIANNKPHVIETRLTDGEVLVGLYVIAGTGERTAKHPTADFTSNPQSALGIVHRDPSYVLPEGATVDKRGDKEPVGVIRKGPVWVKPEAEHPAAIPTPDSPVYVRVTAGTGKPAGSLRASAGEKRDELKITVSATENGHEFELEANGEDLGFESGDSQTAEQKATAWAADIDGKDGWSATATGTVITALHSSGLIEVDDGSAGTGFTYEVKVGEGSAVAVKLPGAFFRRNGSGGVSEVELNPFDEVGT